MGSSALGVIYENIYSAHENVWEDQGRDALFRAYFASLVDSFGQDEPLLELGCGEGLLLSSMNSKVLVGIDPSIQALLRARRRTRADLAAAQAEHLPLATGSVGVVTAVGVMEHFSDPPAAIREIFRVLKDNGVFVTLIHLDMGRLDRILLKIREYVFPRPRPIRFGRWLLKKLHKPIRQPFRRSYSVSSASALLLAHGMRVEQVLSVDSHPQLPLAGEHVVILVARKFVGG